MDGGFENESIDLHREIIKVDNIVSLFEMYGVPKKSSNSNDDVNDSFDVFSEDTDMSDYWIWRNMSPIIIRG